MNIKTGEKIPLRTNYRIHKKNANSIKQSGHDLLDTFLRYRAIREMADPKKRIHKIYVRRDVNKHLYGGRKRRRRPRMGRRNSRTRSYIPTDTVYV